MFYPTDFKRCNWCGREKPLSDFMKTKGYTYKNCKECVDELTRIKNYCRDKKRYQDYLAETETFE